MATADVTSGLNQLCFTKTNAFSHLLATWWGVLVPLSSLLDTIVYYTSYCNPVRKYPNIKLKHLEWSLLTVGDKEIV